jgi:hypothetical protein
MKLKWWQCGTREGLGFLGRGNFLNRRKERQEMAITIIIIH